MQSCLQGVMFITINLAKWQTKQGRYCTLCGGYSRTDTLGTKVYVIDEPKISHQFGMPITRQHIPGMAGQDPVFLTCPEVPDLQAAIVRPGNTERVNDAAWP